MDHAPVSNEQVEWERRYPQPITSDPIGKLLSYRGALFLLDSARADIQVGAKRGLYPEISATARLSSVDQREHR